MPTISIRVEDKLFEEIEKKRNGASKSDFYREIIEHFLKTSGDVNTHLNTLNTSVNTPEDRGNARVSALEAELQARNELLSLKDKWITDLETNIGFLQLEYQKLSAQVIPQLTEENGRKKKWWQVWKR